MQYALGYDTNLYSQSQFDTALAGAFQAWEDISQLDFEYTASAAASDIDIWMEFLAGPTIGAATISFFPDTPFGQIVSGEIRLDSSEQWAPVGETDLNFYAVALHEIGHVIGLEHVPDASEIMNASVSTLDLGDGDILGARVLYGDEEGAVVPPAEEDPIAASGGGLGFGLIAVILGAIAALLGLGPGGILAAAALKSGDDDPEDADAPEDRVLLTDLIPSTGALAEFEHVLHDMDDDEDDQAQDLLTLV